MVATPTTAPKAPNAALRSRGGKDTWITDRTCGYINAAMRPWITRAVTKNPPEVEKPHRADAAVKPATPIMNSRLRPKMSPSRPPVMSVTA